MTMLSHQYPTVRSAAAEIVNLQAIQGLPKGGEHFIVSDIENGAYYYSHISRLPQSGERNSDQNIYSKGSLYKIHNGNLLFHGCIPLTKSGELMSFALGGKTRSARSPWFCENVPFGAKRGLIYCNASAILFSAHRKWGIILHHIKRTQLKLT